MPPRLHLRSPIDAVAEGGELALDAAAARHVRVLRLQPGDALVVFDGSGFEWTAELAAMHRSEVVVRLGARAAPERELALRVTLAVGMPANERMDTLVEKATELGVAAIQPLVCTRSVLRLAGERAERRVAHWQAVAVAACEQCGRTRVPEVAPVATLADWLGGLGEGDAMTLRAVLSLAADARPLPAACASMVALSGPEGGLTGDEEAAARARGFRPVRLGPRVLRADTAPLALLAHLALQ